MCGDVAGYISRYLSGDGRDDPGQHGTVPDKKIRADIRHGCYLTYDIRDSLHVDVSGSKHVSYYI
jgi:hypothetical protein